MGIKLINSKQVIKLINDFGSERVHDVIINRFNRVGLNFITNARTIHTYKDRESQLRNSIGYVVSYKGSVIISDFNTEGKEGLGRDEGILKGEQFANEISENINNYVLVCVAGANYAAYVEAKGYDVITGSELKAIDELERIFG